MRSTEKGCIYRIIYPISFIAGWIIGIVLEFARWAVLIAMVGLWLGFFLYVGWFAARGTFPDLIPWVQGLLGK